MATGGVITNAGKQLILKRIYSNSTANPIQTLSVGTGTTTPAETDTALENAVLTGISILGGPLVDSSTNTLTTKYFISSLQANGYNLSECGEFNSDNVMLGRDVFTAISKTNAKEITIIMKHRCSSV